MQRLNRILPISNTTELQARQRSSSSKGLTLLEMALAMMILAILSVGVSSLVKTAVESQMAQRSQETLQNIGVNIVDDLRRDIRQASAASVTGGGRTLTLTMPAGGNVIYQWTGSNDFTRQDFTAGGALKTYNDPTQLNPRVQVDCNDTANGVSTCFTAAMMNNDPVPQPRQIKVNAIRVYQSIPSNGGTVIDRMFQPPSFILRSFTFDVMSATEFR